MAAATTNGYTNGINGTHTTSTGPLYPRFSEIPAVIDIPVRGEEGEEAVNLDLTELLDETDELCDLLENENAAKTYWITIALAYAKQDKPNFAIDILNKGLKALRKEEERLGVLTCLCWLYLWKCRHAPRVKRTQPAAVDEDRDERTKDVFLHQATQALNDASRVNPSYPPLFLARGTLYLLRASLQPSKSGSGSQEQSERNDTLKRALSAFEDAFRASNGKNIFAVLGKAKSNFSLGNIPAALNLYQQALERAPDMNDPDPRIGIGCCLWTLGHKDLAQTSWQRSLELNPTSQIAHILLGLAYLDQAYRHSPSDQEFQDLYKKAITDHTQTAFKLGGMHALTCATFGPYFLAKKSWNNAERLARRAIEHTDVNATASDGWYLLARNAHYSGDLRKAAEHYTKADQARGGEERGWLPAKFGGAQLRVLDGDFDGAKFRLEKIVEKGGRGEPANVESMTLLGILHAEDVFAAQANGTKEDKSVESRKAIGMLEQVRVAWKDSKRKLKPDTAVLLNLARLYENDQPEKALLCLQEVEKMELENIFLSDEEKVGDEEEEFRLRHELLPPQLHNNIGCFHFQAEKFAEAREDFQTALNACVKQGDRQQEDEDGNIIDTTDALVSTISYNLARTYEAEGIDDEAQKVYQGLLERHPDYVDARTRLAYLTLKSSPTDGAEAIKALLESDPSNLDVRALYAYHIHSAKRRTLALNEDSEQRHYKHTLQNYDKHDLYALTGMGNLHLVVAREMPRETDQHQERRAKMYARAVEFFDKVLTLDPRNAFAAQGMGIAVVEEKRDAPAGIQIFSKVRESVKEASVFVNLGHVFTEVKQYSRAIENYEMALVKSGQREKEGILACLGRVWLIRGRQEKRLECYKTSLEFSQRALELAPDNVNFRFNVAFVQIQLAQMIISLPEAQKTLQDVEAASAGLDEAIDEFGRIAREPNPPFPRGDIEQRASMGRNTMRKQLATAIERQREYEDTNRERLEEARRKREEAIAKAEADRREAAEKAEEERRKIKEERERIAAEDRALIERRMEEERAREAEMWTTDSETGERKKREKKPKAKKRRKGQDSDDDGIINDGTPDVEGGSGRKSRPRSGATTATGSEAEGGGRRKKKRKLESRKGRAQSSKYKSADTVVESSDEEELDGVTQPPAAATSDANEDEDGRAETPGGETPGALSMPDDEEDEAANVQRNKARRRARILDDDVDEDEDEDREEEGGGVAEAGDSDHGGDTITADGL